MKLASSLVSGRTSHLMMVVCVGLAATVGGCQQNASRSGTKAASAGEREALTPVSVSTLREKAIQIVEETAKAEDPTLRANAAEAASYSPTRLKPIIEKALKDPNPGVRGVAATAVGMAKVGGVSGILRELTSDPSAAVQVSAIYGILANGGEIDRTPLGQILMEDPSASVKRHAVDVLGMLGDGTAKPLLRSAAKERFAELSPAQMRLLHIQISAALVKLGENSERPVIIAALYPSQPEELEATVLAIQCIGGLKDSSAAAHLINLADYKDRAGKKYPPEVRLAVAAALAQLGMPEGSFVAEEYVHSSSPTVRSQVAFVYGETKGSRNGARLEQLLSDPDAQVRISAAAAVLKSLSRR